MSLVGTRPPTVDEWDKYELHHRARLATKPGLTGMWQVSGRSNITDFEEVVKLDKQYISEWTMGLDIKILFKTVQVVFKKGIDVGSRGKAMKKNLKDKKSLNIAMLGHKRIPSREGGIEIVVEELATRMVTLGHKVTCYNRSGHHVSGKDFDGGKRKAYKGVRLKSVLTFDKKGLAAMTASVSGAICAAFGKYDVVHFHLNEMVEGGIVFIDEFDSNIHDVYLCALLEYLMEYGKGQLCFTTHNVGPMDVLKHHKKSIDFLSEDHEIYSWTTSGNYSPSKLYRNGMIEGSPFNIDSIDFIGIFGSGEEDE